MISVIVAVSTNNVIGFKGALPWHLPDDLRRFKAITMGKPVVMGRKTFESIGRALPGRQNIVISSRVDFAAAGCEVVTSAAAAVASAADAVEIMVIGGAGIYALFLPLATRVYLTRVHVVLAGDTHFPNLDEREWRTTERLIRDNDDRHQHRFEFITLDRIVPD
jgi:dihydrofolate reductase